MARQDSTQEQGFDIAANVRWGRRTNVRWGRRTDWADWEQCYWCPYWTLSINAYTPAFDYEISGGWPDPPRPLCDWCFDWYAGQGYYENHPEVLEAGGRLYWRGGPYEPSALTRAEDWIAFWFDDLPDPIPDIIAEYLYAWHEP